MHVQCCAVTWYSLIGDCVMLLLTKSPGCKIVLLLRCCDRQKLDIEITEKRHYWYSKGDPAI